jgi:hypothetical protein
MTSQSQDKNFNLNAKDILVIGGGKSVLDYEIGSIIDTFPNIGRINNYQTKGYEVNIGSKTNIWFNGANQGLKINTHIPPRVVVLIPPKILVKKGAKIHDRIIRRLNTKEYELVSKNKMDKFENNVKSQRLTTGTNSVLWSLENFNRVFIHGFDFFIDSKTHYNDSKIKTWLIEYGIIKKAQKHDISKEKHYIENLISQGKIIKLVDYIS